MSLNPDVKWGIWTNGVDKIFIEKCYSPSVSFRECFNIPSKGFFEVSEEIKHDDLKNFVDLKSIFKSLRAYISANSVGTWIILMMKVNTYLIYEKNIGHLWMN